MYSVNVEDGLAPDLQNLAPSSSESLGAAVGNTFNENISVLGYDALKTKSANSGEKLDRATAEGAIKEAGVKLKVPDDGYTKEALDILIKRQRDQAARQSVMDRTPWSWLGSPVRGTAMLLTGLTDPLNVASAFIPVVGEARAASMLAKAGTGLAARAGARAVIGAAEGAAGAAILEPAIYGLHTQLQDDYSMSDSLVNIAFGGLLGGGLHAVGGSAGDILRSGPDPYARFAGLETKQVSQVLEYEKAASRGGELPNTEQWSTTMRRAAGLEESVPALDIEVAVLRQPGEPRRQSNDAALAPEAPFAKLYERTPEQARASALEEMHDDLRSDLLAEAGNRAPSQQVPEIQAKLKEITGRIEKLDSESEFKARAKLEQQQGLSRKQAESSARKLIAADQEDAIATRDRLTKQLETDAKSSRAEQDIATLDKGQVPSRFEDRVQARANSLMADSGVARAITGTSEPPARFVIGMASPETREAALRSAVADMANGRFPDIDALVRSDRGTIGAKNTASDVASAANRQQHPDAVATGSPEASRAAERRIQEAPKEHAIEAAKAELDSAMQRLSDLQKNLTLSGISPEKIEAITEGLKAFDDAIKDADNIGKAIVQNALCGIRQ